MAQTPSPPRYCHTCGGPGAATGQARACSYCGGPLVPMGTPDPRQCVRCPSCARAASAGASFCSACGTALARIDAKATQTPCPGCAAEHESSSSTEPASTMHACGLLPTARRPQGHPVLGCRRCGGVWIDTETLEAIMRAADDDAPPSGMGGGVRRRRMARGSMSAPIRYRKCIACGHRMLRRNFARISGVVVDQCRRHGTYFDAGELEDVLAFIRSGGLEAARRTDDAERARDLRRARPVARSDDADSWGAGPRADLGSAFLRWAGRWLEGS